MARRRLPRALCAHRRARRRSVRLALPDLVSPPRRSVLVVRFLLKHRAILMRCIRVLQRPSRPRRSPSTCTRPREPCGSTCMIRRCMPKLVSSPFPFFPFFLFFILAFRVSCPVVGSLLDARRPDVGVLCRKKRVVGWQAGRLTVFYGV